MFWFFGKKANQTQVDELKIFPGHEGIAHFRDLNYIIRIIRKISKELPKRSKDIDWLQVSIEMFLILNSRVYNDLLKNLVKEIRMQNKIPETINKEILQTAQHTLSFTYHKERKYNRHLAAHSSNYQRVGIPEFKNDYLPRPINYYPTLPLYNMAKVKDLVRMWQAEMYQSANDIEEILGRFIKEFNTYENQTKRTNSSKP